MTLAPDLYHTLYMMIVVAGGYVTDLRSLGATALTGLCTAAGTSSDGSPTFQMWLGELTSAVYECYAAQCVPQKKVQQLNLHDSGHICDGLPIPQYRTQQQASPQQWNEMLS
jgi:hypothetical protein